MPFSNLKIGSKFQFPNCNKIYRKLNNLFATRKMRNYYIEEDQEVIEVESEMGEYEGEYE